MRSEQLENIIALLRSSDSNGPSTVDDWRVAYDNLGRLVPANPDIAVEPADGVRGEWIGDGDGSIVVYLHGGARHCARTRRSSAVRRRRDEADHRLTCEIRGVSPRRPPLGSASVLQRRRTRGRGQRRGSRP